MYSFSFILLVFVQTYGAPINSTTQLSEPIAEEIVSPLPEVILNQQLTLPGIANDTLKGETILVNVVGTVNVSVEGTPLPPTIDVIEEIQSDLSSEKQKILDAGKHLSEAITAKIVGPVVIFNSKVAAAAGALPPLLAAKGAVIGSVIATPIEIGAVAGSSIVSGVTGKLVAIPISVATGTIAKVVGAAEKGRQIWNFNLEHGGEILKDGFIRMGHIILKPVAVVVGAQTALNGAGLGIAGAGIKGVGVGIEKIGAKMLTTGLAAKGLGATLIKSQFVI